MLPRHAAPQGHYEHAGLRFSLPVQYFRDEHAGVLLYGGAREAVQALLPQGARLRPVPLGRRRALVGIGCFHYRHSTLGEYGELVVLIPCLEGLSQRRLPQRAQYVPQMCVTSREAQAVGTLWGYPKRMTDMAFHYRPGSARCRVEEGGRHILTVEQPKGGRLRPYRARFADLTVKDGCLLRTELEMTGIQRLALRPRGARLALGDHPIADMLRALELSRRPLLGFDFPERYCVLPRGQIVQRGVLAPRSLVGGARAGHLAATFSGSSPA